MRPWALALGLSLALHLSLVVAFRVDTKANLSPSPPQGVRGDAFISFTPVEVPPRPEAPKPAPRAPVKSLPPSGLRAESRDEGPSRDEGAEVEAEAGAAAEGPSTPPGEENGSTPVASGERAAEAPAAPGPDVTALVHARLAAVADRCYPAAARRFQQRGTVQLSFCTDASGGTSSTSITQSSGADLLDSAARGCVVESASPFPPEAASRCFSVPVRFGARQ